MERDSPAGCMIMPFCNLHPSNLGMLGCPALWSPELEP
jgi:hypothetical protein